MVAATATALVALLGASAAFTPSSTAQTADPTTTAPTTTAPTTTAPTTTGTGPPTTTGAPAPGSATAEPGIGPRRAISLGDPLRVAIIGDSVMNTARPGITAALESTTVARVATEGLAPFGGFGLTGAYDWRSVWPPSVDAEQPEVVVLMFGGWDEDMARLNGAGYYRQVLDQAVATLTAQGATLLFIGAPAVTPGARKHRDRERINALLAELPGRFPGRVVYLDAEPVLGDALGNYRDYIDDASGALVRARKKDGAHLCVPGAAALATSVHEALIAQGWALPPPSPGWDLGPWTGDPIYVADPVGACDPG